MANGPFGDLSLLKVAILCMHLEGFNTLPGEGLRITRPGGGGGQNLPPPPAISAPVRARNTKFGRWVVPYKDSEAKIG